MECPTPCKCGELVDLHDMNTCDICRELFCEQCCDEPWGICEICKFGKKECVECSDWVDEEKIVKRGKKKGMCEYCKEVD